MRAHLIVRSVAAGALLAALTLVAGCAVPLGPGYRFGSRYYEVSSVTAEPAHVHVRISDSLENVGNRDLSFLDVNAPISSGFAGTRLTVRVADEKEQTFEGENNSIPAVRVRFDRRWRRIETRDVTFDYDASAVSGAAFSAAGANDFYLVDPSAFPEWSPPLGPFSTGELRALDERLSLTVPSDWLVLALGRGQRKVLAAGLVRHEFRIVGPHSGGDSLPPFVIAGRFQELRIPTSGRTVVFWTIEPLDAVMAKSAAERLAKAIAAYEDVFGPLPGDGIMRVIEAPSEMSRAVASKSNAEEGGRALSFPNGVMLNREAFAQGLGNDRVVASMEDAMVHSWLGWRVHPLPDSQLARGAGRFAELLAAEAGGADAVRRSVVAETIAAYDHDSSSSASPAVSPRVRDERAFLFLVALQDLAGKEKFARAMRHVMRAMAGQDVGDEELRSALEEETHSDLAGTFRAWLGDAALPPDFRARYTATQSAR